MSSWRSQHDRAIRAPSAALRATESKSNYEALRDRASSAVASWVGLAWGLAEATLFFIVPDVLLGAVALVAPRAAPRVLAFTLVGALLGGALTYGIANELRPSRSEAVLDGVPTVNDAAIQRVEREMRDEGSRSIVYGPLRMGTPYKLYARAAAVEDEPFGSFVLWSIPGRLERMLPVTLLAALVGFLARSWIASRPWAVLACYGALWLAVYVVYVVRTGI
jgi:membrane protein YqaA with SNARE-associated domain